MNILLDEKILSLFRISLELRASFNKLDREAEKVQEIAMNASVAAGQTGSYIRIYTEIANQIAISAKKMKAKITAAKEEINHISNLSLQSLSAEEKQKKYIEAIHLAEKENTKKMLKKEQHIFTDEIQENMYKIKIKLHPTSAALNSILQIQYRLFGALSSLKVELNEIYGSQQQAIIALSENLAFSIEKGIKNIAELSKIMREINYNVKAVIEKTKL